MQAAVYDRWDLLEFLQFRLLLLICNKTWQKCALQAKIGRMRGYEEALCLNPELS